MSKVYVLTAAWCAPAGRREKDNHAVVGVYSDVTAAVAVLGAVTADAPPGTTYAVTEIDLDSDPIRL